MLAQGSTYLAEQKMLLRFLPERPVQELPQQQVEMHAHIRINCQASTVSLYLANGPSLLNLSGRCPHLSPNANKHPYGAEQARDDRLGHAR